MCSEYDCEETVNNECLVRTCINNECGFANNDARKRVETQCGSGGCIATGYIVCENGEEVHPCVPGRS